MTPFVLTASESARRTTRRIGATAAMVLVAAAATAYSSYVWAHGERSHSAHSAGAADMIKEQTDWGIGGEAAEVTRTIEVDMTDDMRFTPNRIDVKLGETVRIVAVNRGQVLHEIVIGSAQELAHHAELMKKHPNMAHDEPYMAHVDPGQKGDIVWVFNRPGTFEFACLIPGHFEAGMTGTIVVQ